MEHKASVRVLFVCTGNICRSPTAEGVARAWIQRLGLEDKILVDSAGTHGYHVGQAPDPRSQEFAQRRGYDLSELRARQVQPRDFEYFDLLLAMDRGHLHTLKGCAPDLWRPRVQLFLGANRVSPEAEVEDPYYGGDAGFEQVLDQCEAGIQGLLLSLGLMPRAQDPTPPPRRPPSGQRRPGL